MFMSHSLNYRMRGVTDAPILTVVGVKCLEPLTIIMSRVSIRIRDRATASGARTDAPPVLTSKWTAGNVKSEQGPHSSYRIRGSRCASLIGGGETSKKPDTQVIDSNDSLLPESESFHGSSVPFDMEPCVFCGKLYKKVRGMAVHLRSCPRKKAHDEAKDSIDPEYEDFSSFCFVCGLKFKCQQEYVSHKGDCKKACIINTATVTRETLPSTDIVSDPLCELDHVKEPLSPVDSAPSTDLLNLVSNRESFFSTYFAPEENVLPDFSLPKESLSSFKSTPYIDVQTNPVSTKESLCSTTSAPNICLLPDLSLSEEFLSTYDTPHNDSVSVDFTVESSIPPAEPSIPSAEAPYIKKDCSQDMHLFDRECKLVLDDVLEIKARKKGGEIVQGYQCYPCKKILTTYRGLEVHRREHPECSNYTHRCVVCTRSFKNEKGLRQHQERYDCGPASLISDPVSSQGVSSGSQQSVDCNDQLLAGLDSHHVAHSQQDFEAERAKLVRLVGKGRIKWPKMSNEKAWKTLDSKAKVQLLTHGSIEGKISVLEEVIYEEAKSLFGCHESSVGPKETLSRREKKLKEVRKQIRHLTKMARNCDDDDEKGGLLLARQDLLDRRRELRQAERKRKQRWRRNNIRKDFYNDPYRTCKKVLSDDKSVPLKVDSPTINKYVQEVASDPLKDVDLGPLPGLPDAPLPTAAFDEGKFKFSDFKYILRKTRNASRPGHNQIPYKVYKKCPELAKYLFGLFLSVLKSRSTPLQWRISDGIFLPKVKNPKENKISDYRQIALLNVEGKLYWALVAKRLYSYLVEDNHYIKTNQQKGSIRGVAGCWEHTTMVWSALKDAKTSRSPLALLWLDLANAYGTVPHKLIEFALRRYHVPDSWIKVVLDYYNGLWGRSSSSGSYSEWTRYEKGIFAGCTISVILFLVAFNVFLDYVDKDDIERYKINGNPIEVFRGFMDDLSTLTTRVPMTALALDRTNTALKWGRMKLKPSKSRSLVMLKGKVLDVEPFSVDGIKIPGLHKEPLRTLGRVFDCSITDKESIKGLQNKFVTSLIKIDKSRLTAFMKLWALHNILQFQIRWDFMIYEIPLYIIESMERKQSIFIRKWLGVSRSLTDVALYSTETPCPLPFKSLVALFKTTKVTSFLQLSHSQDNQVTSCLKEHNTGKKWSTSAALSDAQARLNHQRLVGDVRGARGVETESTNLRAGLGFISAPSIPNSDGQKEHRQHISKIIQEDHSNQLTVKAVNQSLQGAWTRWKQYLQRDLSWKSLLAAKTNLVRFCVGSTFDTLSTPNNLQRMGLITNPRCTLCNQDGCGILHILTACPVAFQQKRYTYRHNNILRSLADGIQSFLNTNKVVSKGIKTIHFIKESGTTKEKRSRKPSLGLLHLSSDFVMDVDLNKQLKYPSHIADSLQRPDIVIHSNKLKIVIHVELTSSGEERFERSNIKKYDTYSDTSVLGGLCSENGWKVYCFAVEVGARGYVAQSLPQCLRKLGLGKLKTRQIVRNCGDTALRSSFWLWVMRDNVDWKFSSGFKEDSHQVLCEATEEVLNPSKEASTQNTNIPFKTKGKRRYPEVKKLILKAKAQTDVRRNVPNLTKLKKGKESGSTLPPCGITNIGNSCFLNSVLQCLFQVLLTTKTGDIQRSSDDALTTVFAQWEDPASKCINPSPIKALLETLSSQFSNQNEQDAHECLMVILSTKDPPSVIQKLTSAFTGCFLSLVTCDLCFGIYESEEPFTCIEVDIPPSTTPTSLNQLLDKFQEEEIITLRRQRVCSLCKQISSAVRKLSIPNTGEWLVFQIKRFMHVGNSTCKNKRFVSYPLEDFLINDQSYDLYGLVSHFGSKEKGHYIAYIRSGMIWYKCDDSITSRVSRSVAAKCNNEVYLLFYKKQAKRSQPDL